MTGGHGVAHSEVSTPDTTVLHGVQLWVALPDDARDQPRDFAHHVPDDRGPRRRRRRPRLPRHAGRDRRRRWSPRPRCSAPSCSSSPAPASCSPSTRPSSTACSSTAAAPRCRDARSARAELGVVDPGPSTLEIVAGDEPARLVLLGGPPFGEQIVMWWNFVGPHPRRDRRLPRRLGGRERAVRARSRATSAVTGAAASRPACRRPPCRTRRSGRAATPVSACAAAMSHVSVSIRLPESGLFTQRLRSVLASSFRRTSDGRSRSVS